MAAATSVGPGRVFISYRRDDSAFPAGWLYDRLCTHLGSAQVFKDVDSIDPGDDFFRVIEDAVGSCQVLLALIGDRWLDITDETGNRRLDDPEDFVRLEIEAGLRRDVRVIPILVGRAPMPRSEQLPDSLRGLVRRHAIELSPNRFESDLARLMRAIDKTLPAIGVGPADTPANTSGISQAPKPPVEKAPDQHGGSETDFGQRSPPITTGGEVATKPGIPAPDDAEAAMVSTEEQPPAVGDDSREAAEATSSKVDTEPAEKRTDAQHSGSPAATQDRLTAFVVPVGTTSTPRKLRLLQRLSRRTKIVLAAGIVVAIVAVVVGIVVDTPPPDPTQQLQAFKDQDTPAVAQLVDRWIPQLSSKHATEPWTYDAYNVFPYDPVQILQEHQRLRQQYGAKLLWSGDWTTYNHPDYWVTVVPQTFPDSASVLSWCTSQGRNADRCSAQIVSKTLGVNGTHAN